MEWMYHCKFWNRKTKDLKLFEARWWRDSRPIAHPVVLRVINFISFGLQVMHFIETKHTKKGHYVFVNRAQKIVSSKHHQRTQCVPSSSFE